MEHGILERYPRTDPALRRYGRDVTLGIMTRRENILAVYQPGRSQP